MGYRRPGALQVAGPHVLPQRQLRRCRLRHHPGLVARQSESLGEGAAAPGQREHRHRPCRQQARLGHREPRQARNTRCRRRAVRQGGRPAVLRDIGQDGRERAGAVHRHRKEAAARPGRSPQHQVRPASWRRSAARGNQRPGRRWLQLLAASSLGPSCPSSSLFPPLLWADLDSSRKRAGWWIDPCHQSLLVVGVRAWWLASSYVVVSYHSQYTNDFRIFLTVVYVMRSSAQACCLLQLDQVQWMKLLS